MKLVESKLLLGMNRKERENLKKRKGQGERKVEEAAREEMQGGYRDLNLSKTHQALYVTS